MNTYQYCFNVISGPGAIDCVGKKVREIGCSRPLICCDEGIVQFGLLKKLTTVLDAEEIPYDVYDRVVPNPLESNVVETASLAKARQSDCLIAIGGGSSMDTAKAASVLMVNGKLIQEDMTKPPKAGPPVIAIPTTSGTGSDMSIGAMISNDRTHAKMAVLTPNPTMSICDPELTLSLPKNATLIGAVDALMHAIEGYTSVHATKYSDLICENCIAAVRKYLPAAMEKGDDLHAREELMFASSSCGSVIATAYLHAGHAIAHAIGGALNITHGLAVITTAPELLNTLAPACPEKVHRIGELLGMAFPEDLTPEVLGATIRGKMIALLRSWGVKSLKDMGIALDALYACVPTILSDLSIYASPRQLHEEDIRRILEVAYTF